MVLTHRELVDQLFGEIHVTIHKEAGEVHEPSQNRCLLEITIHAFSLKRIGCANDLHLMVNGSDTLLGATLSIETH